MTMAAAVGGCSEAAVERDIYVEDASDAAATAASNCKRTALRVFA